MAIALDAFVDIQTTTGTSLTYAHTVSGSDRLLIVDSITTGNATGVTYNGVALTLITSVTDDASRIHKLWYLIAPATGANNVVISTDASVFIRGTSASYTGVDQTSPIDASGTAVNIAPTSVNVALTSTVADDWGVGSYRSDDGSNTDGTLFQRAVANSLGYTDTNGGLGSTGTENLNFNISGGHGWLVAALIKPTAAAGPTNLKSLDTNVKANIKSYNTNVIANIKSINTNA